jgi:hypothetical protein
VGIKLNMRSLLTDIPNKRKVIQQTKYRTQLSTLNHGRQEL